MTAKGQAKLSQQNRVVALNGTSAGVKIASAPFTRRASSKALKTARESTVWRASAMSSNSVGTPGRLDNEQSHSPLSLTRRRIFQFGISSSSSASAASVQAPCRQPSLDMCRFARPPQYRKPLAGTLHDLPKQCHCHGVGGLQLPIQSIQFCRLHRTKAHETTSTVGGLQCHLLFAGPVIKKPERSTPKDINLACRSKRHLYSLLMLVTAFWSGIPMAWASHHHTRAASGFLCENHHADSVQKERETDDDFRSRDSVGRFAYWRVGQERGRFTSLSDCSLGGLGDDFPKRACSPATLKARSLSAFVRTIMEFL